MINSVNICGRLARDVEVRKTTTGKSVASFSVGVQRNTKEKEMDWINVVAWNATADFLSNYSHKGDMVAVSGRLQTRTYDDQYGKTVYVTEIVANEVQLIATRKAESQPVVDQPEVYDGPGLDITPDDLPF